LLWRKFQERIEMASDLKKKKEVEKKKERMKMESALCYNKTRQERDRRLASSFSRQDTVA
jgi:hypothetical protein